MPLRSALPPLWIAPFVLALPLFAACAKDAPPSPAASATAPATAETTPAAAAAPPAPQGSPPPSGPAAGCALEPEKVWATNASPAAGLTQTVLPGGRVAYGVVVGGRPDVVLFDERGEGRMMQVGLKKALTAPLKREDGRREVLRVTPGVGSGGEVLAFVDYRESGVASRRLVACGASDATTDLVKFEGKPLVATPEDGAAPQVAASASPAPSASGTSRLVRAPRPAGSGGLQRPPALRPIDPATAAKIVKRKAIDESSKGTAPAASAEVPSTVPSITAKPKGDKLHEIRDCRTLVDSAGAHAFSVGSELVGQPYDDGTTQWSMVFFAARELGRGRVDLSVSPLGKSPARLPVFEVPSAVDLGEGTFALATRHRGSILAWLLDSSRRPKGTVKVYAGASPQPPRWARVDADVLLSVVQRDPSGRGVSRFARLTRGATELPAQLTDLTLAEAEPSGALATALLGSQRYLAYQAGEAARRLLLSPVDAALASAGAPLWVDSAVQESSVTPVGDGRLLVVYLRAGAAGRVEIVSRVAKCG